MSKSGHIVLLIFVTMLFVLAANAQQPAKGILLVQSAPGGAKVYVDDEPMGTTSPAGRLKLPLKPGKHSVRVSLAGFMDWERGATLEAGRIVNVTAELVAVQGAQSLPATQAQTPDNGPSYQDTINWIVTKMAANERIVTVGQQWYEDKATNVNYQYPFGHWNVMVAQSFQGCLYSYTDRAYEHIWKNNGGSVFDGGITYTDNVMTIDLSKTSPKITTSTGFHYDEFYPQTRVYNGNVTPGVFLNAPNSDGKGNVSLGYYNPNYDGTLTPRLVAAFSRAIELCGGKAEPF